MDTVFLIVGAIFVIGGLVMALNIGGTADRLGRRDQSQRGDPSGTPPESHFAMRLWGVALLFVGVLVVILGFLI